MASTPKRTEDIGVTYVAKTWDVGIVNKRVGTMHNDNGAIYQAVTIHPFNVTNFYAN